MQILKPPSALRSRYRYNAALKRYISSTGRIVSWRRVRSELDAMVRSSERNMADVTQRLQGGRIGIAQWQREMAREMKSLHMASYALQKGGWAQMTPADYGRVGGLLQFEYRKLRQFAKDIASGVSIGGRMVARARQYSRAARHTYLLALRLDMKARGFDQERSTLQRAEHCAECVAQAGAGWQPIGSMTPIGERECLRNCQCFYWVQNTQTGEQEGPF